MNLSNDDRHWVLNQVEDTFGFEMRKSFEASDQKEWFQMLNWMEDEWRESEPEAAAVAVHLSTFVNSRV